MDQGRPGRSHPQGQRDGDQDRLHRGAALIPGQRLAWHGFGFDLPPGWEVTAYRLGAAKGEFRIHERLRERAQLTWVRLKAPPDPEALIRDLHQRQQGGTALRFVRVGRFTVGCGAKGMPFQAVAFIEHDMRLLHWIFPAWEGEDAAAQWAAMLLSLSCEAGDEREWALFGLRAVLPRACEPREVEAVAGAVTLTFARRDGLVVSLRRLALARHVLAERPLPSLVRRHLVIDEKARVESLDEVGRGGHAAVHARFSVRGERPWDRVAWRRWPGESWTWHRADLNRLVAIEQVGPPAAPRLDLEHACPL